MELVAAFADLAVEAGGPAALRDVIAEDGWSSPIWTRADCYQFGAERAALEAYERAVLTEKLTEFRRFTTGTVAPHAAAYPGDEWVKRLIAQLNSIESTIDLVASA
uniref:RacP protein n=1 Tax=Streptomyces corallincola TaxID=2851888 RepID=UPI001FE398AC|nr:RacP protein [Streptomyces corallincola]